MKIGFPISAFIDQRYDVIGLPWLARYDSSSATTLAYAIVF
jgi:hypothetical protein